MHDGSDSAMQWRAAWTYCVCAAPHKKPLCFSPQLVMLSGVGGQRSDQGSLHPATDGNSTKWHEKIKWKIIVI